MSSIDERVVQMRFQNGSFEKGLSETTNSLRRFKQDLKFDGALGGLDSVKNSVAGVKFDLMASDLDQVNSKLSILGVVGFTAIQAITNKALSLGKTIVGSVLDPLVEGGKRRAQNIEQAKFMLDGLKVAWSDIEPAISGAVQGTAFGLDEAAKAASSLYASNVPLDRMQGSLRAIAGVAAMTGSSYTDMAQIFTTVAGNGRLMTSELNRIGQRGLNAASALAKYLGVTEEVAREMTTAGKIGFETFAAAMDEAFGEQSQKANDTYAGSLANVRAALSRIGEIPAAGNYERLRRIFVALAPQIDNVKNALKPLLTLFSELQVSSGDKLAGIISNIDLSQLEPGLANISQGFRNLLGYLGEFSKRVSKVWEKAFPKTQGTWFVSLTNGFLKLTEAVKPAEKSLNNFETALSILAGVAQVFKTILMGVWSIFKAAIGVVTTIIGLLYDLIKPFFSVGGASDSTGDSVSGFFDMLSRGIDGGIKPVVEWLNRLREALQNLREGGTSGNKYIDMVYKAIKKFTEISSDKISATLATIKRAIEAFLGDGNQVDRIRAFFAAFDVRNLDLSGLKSFGDGVWSTFKGIGKFLMSAKDEIVRIAPDILSGIAVVMDTIWGFISSISANDVLATVQTGGIFAVLYIIWDHMRSVNGLIKSVSAAVGAIPALLQSFQDHLKTIQTSMKIDNFLKVAVAIAILAGALWLLAGIPTDKLISGGIALAAIAGGLMLMYFALDKMTMAMTPTQAAAMSTAATTMVILASAVAILAFSVKKLSDIDMWGLVRGTTAVIGILLGLALAVKIMSTGSRLMVGTAFAIGIFASSLWIMASAVKAFAKIPTDDLIKGGIAVASAIAILSLAIMMMSTPKNSANLSKAGFALLALVGSILILQFAMQKFADMDAEDLSRGALVASIAIGALVGSAMLLSKFAPNALTGAAAVAIMAGSLVVIAFAFNMLSEMSTGDLIGKVLAMSIVIGVLAVIAKVMSGIDGVLGAASVAILAGSLLLISYAISNLSDIDTGKLFGVVLAMGLLMGIITALGFIAGQMPMVLVAIAAIALAVGALGILMFGISSVLSAFKGVIEAIVGAFQFFVDNADGIIDGLIKLAEATEKIQPYTDTMFEVGLALGALGLGALAAGIGFSVLGTSLVLLGIGMAAIAIFGPVGTVALVGMVEAMAELLPQAGPIAIVGGALGILGIGMILVGLGGIIGAAGAMGFALALRFLIPALESAGPAMETIAGSAKKSVDGLMPLIGMAFGLGVFGGAALVASGGAIALGFGLILLGNGLKLASKFGGSGSEGLVTVVENLKPLWTAAVKIGIVAGALTTLGIALGIAGGGLVIAAVGAMAFSGGMAVFQTALPGFVDALTNLEAALTPVAATVTSKLSEIATAVVTGGMIIALAIIGMATSVQSSMGNVTAAFNALGVSIATAMGTGIQAGMLGAQSIILVGLLGIILMVASQVGASSGLFIVSGMAIALAVAQGIIMGGGQVSNSGRMILMLLSNTLRSGSGIMIVTAVALMSAFVTGVYSSSGRVYQAGAQVASSLSSGLRNGLSSAAGVGFSGGYAVGSAIASGAQAGIRSGSSGVISAAISMASSAIAAAKSELDINSPSKVFTWMGAMLPAGLVSGVDSGTADVVGSVKTLARQAIGTMSAAMRNLDAIMDSDFDMSMTITPTLDLTGVHRSAAYIGDLLNVNPIETSVSARMASAHIDTIHARDEALANAEEPGNAGIQFNQTINSPTPLSSIEIYRQTNNLVSRAKPKE